MKLFFIDRCEYLSNRLLNELGYYLKENGEEIKDQIRTRSYQPKPVKRIEIPKADGGVRNLGVPTVVDRFFIFIITHDSTDRIKELF